MVYTLYPASFSCVAASLDAATTLSSHAGLSPVLFPVGAPSVNKITLLELLSVISSNISFAL